MSTTSISLLRRLKDQENELDWRRFLDLYAPLIFYWGRRSRLTVDDSLDLVQEVVAILVKKLPEFEYEPGKRFRG